MIVWMLAGMLWKISLLLVTWRQHVPAKLYCLSTKQHGTSQKTVILKFAVVRTSFPKTRWVGVGYLLICCLAG